MLLKKDLLERLEEKYRPMFDKVSIPDFTKCIAEFSQLHISDVSDAAIEEYLTLWAKNKYRFYQLLGNKLRVDTKIRYEANDNNTRRNMFHDLGKSYPAYVFWLKEFYDLKKNKIESCNISWNCEHTLNELFPDRTFEGTALTHFFKNYLSAPDDLVTQIGRIFENQELEAIHTISIDPVDMMLASENPYNWTSCYRLGDGGHADGTLAAMIDGSSLITYIWHAEGEFSLHNNYTFKNVRYKQMRQYISISPTMNSIHFNSVYPGKDYADDFEKQLRQIVEDLVDKDATWVKNSNSDCDREFYYGYGEFSVRYIWTKKDAVERDVWRTYSQEIVCPCGCGNYLPGSDDDIDYDDSGFTYENINNRHYCDMIDGYCAYEDCDSCPAYNRENAVCELDEDHYCEGNLYEAEEEDCFDPDESRIVHCDPEFCSNCPFYELHHQKDIDAENDERKIAEMAV